MEYLCDGTGMKVEEYECSEGCVDGACIVPETIDPICEDSDNGLNNYVKGYTTSNFLGEEPELNIYHFEDWCGISGQPGGSGNKVEECSGSLCMLNDYACNEEGRLYGDSIPCLGGCNDGVCTSEAPIEDDNEEDTSNVSECVESDAGKDYFVKSNGLSIPNRPLYTSSEHCLDEDTLVEYFCPNNPLEDAPNYFEHYDCPNGCENGACLSGEIENYENIIIDSFGEYNIRTNDQLSFDNLNRRIEIVSYTQCGDINCTYEILKEGIKLEVISKRFHDELFVNDSTILVEDDTPMVGNIKFSGVGIQLISLSQDSALIDVFNASSPIEFLQRCVEMGDSGKDYEFKGIVYGFDRSRNNLVIIEDRCENSPDEDYLWEYYCIDDPYGSLRENYEWQKIWCEYGCENGACEGAEECLELGFRKENKYCSDKKYFLPQKSAEESCDNDFECTSNLCIGGECISSSLWRKFISWLKNIFR